MSLSALVASFDDEALVALANKGLLRRAKKAESAARVHHFNDESAKVEVDGFQVDIPATGPQSATCTCPAPGMCSHILTAMLALRGANPEPPQPQNAASPKKATPETPTDTGAIAGLVAMDAQLLEKFAGADFAPASTLAATAEIVDRAEAAQVRFASPESSVTFVANQPLSAALYKGPSTRKRLVVAAAALAIRDREGVARSQATLTATPTPASLATDTLPAIAQALEAAITQVFLGSAALTQERLLDLAISAKVQSAPRLTGHLHSLSTQAGWAEVGDIRFDGGQFLAALAQAYALVKALGQSPDAPDLLGIARRSYDPSPAVTLWGLGANAWATPGGARGLTFYLLNPETGAWHSATSARAAGMDATFTPARAYDSPLWGAGSFSTLSGTALSLDAPHMDKSGQLSVSAKTVAQVNGPLQARAFLDSPVILDDWAALVATMQERMGHGLRRGAVPLPNLIKPTAIDPPQFDDISQRYLWQVRDAAGRALPLSARPKDMAHLQSLPSHFPGSALLILSSMSEDALHHKAITLFVPKGDTLITTNLDFHPAPEGNLLARAKGGLRKGLRRWQGRGQSNPHLSFAAQTLTALAEQSRHAQPKALARLADQAEARQLLLLAGRLRLLQDHPCPANVLAAAYVCRELTAIEALNTLD
ncbi:hypothetical protein J7443_09425 [Tropicibacter sp. R15_0]|uniref:hypothetical protein n=1 Tax=Tropicibacter sp. R15_0 TaxID=2821101 RepID=UPI001ADC07A8|nr:hypothetical protein [Tropicibacter sp. R15_0]MBO9465447.1 hypothetical protein [Tropicibacter sp. R15_0]